MWCPVHTMLPWNAVTSLCFPPLVSFHHIADFCALAQVHCLCLLPRTCTITLSLEDSDCTSFTFYSFFSSFDAFASDFQLAFSCLKFDPNCLIIVLPALDLLWICSLHFKLDHITTIFSQHHSKYLWTDRLHPSALDQCFSHYVSQPISEFSSQFSGLW